MAVTPSSKPSAKNIKALNSLYKSGSITNITSGWHTFTFDTAYSVQPIVNVQAIGQGASSEVRNVGTTSFDYRILSNGADADGGSMQWFAYIEGVSGDAVLDQVNDIIGADYGSIDDLLSNQTDFAKVCASVPAMNVLFVYEPAIDEIAGSEPCIDTIMATSTSYQSLDGYISLNSAIESTDYGWAKRYYRDYSGQTSTTAIHGLSDVFASAQYATICANYDAMNELTSSKMQQLCGSAQGLNGLCKTAQGRQAFTSRWRSAFTHWSTMQQSLGNATYFTLSQASNQWTDISYSTVSNAMYAPLDQWYTGDSDSAYDTAKADACFCFCASFQLADGGTHKIETLVNTPYSRITIVSGSGTNSGDYISCGGWRCIAANRGDTYPSVKVWIAK